MKIGIVNGWGCNRGSEAMYSSILCYFNSIHCQVETTIYIDDKWLDLTRHKKLKLKPWIRKDDLWSSMPQKLRKFYVWMGLIWSNSLYLPDESIMNHDFVFSAPDGPYFGDRRPFSDMEMQSLLQLAICHRKGIPFGILSTSSGPFLDKFRNTIRKPIFDKAEFWTFREPITVELVSNLNLNANVEQHMGGDVVFAHPKRRMEEFLDSASLEEFEQLLQLLKAKPFILVTVQADFKDYRPLHGSVVPFDSSSYVIKMAKLLQHVIDKTKCQLLITSHLYGDIEEQRLFREIISLTERQSEIRILNPLYNAEAQMFLYQYAEFAISNRYHPLIFASKAECPFLCISHQFKHDGLLKLFGKPGVKVTSIDSSEKWIKAFDENWINKDNIKQQISERLPDVVKSSKQHLEILGKHIKQASLNRRN